MEFGDFLDVRRRFGTILGAKTGPRRVLFRVFGEKTVFFNLGRIFTRFLGQNAEKSLTAEKRDFLKTIVLPRENDDFQGSLPVQKRYAGFLIHTIGYHKTYPKFFENRRFFDEKSI